MTSDKRGAARAAAPLLGLALGALALAACTDWAGYDLDKAYDAVPQLSTMRNSVVPDPYAMPRAAPEHSVPSESPAGDVPAHFTQAQLDSAAATLTNPHPAASAEVLARGKLKFEQNCAACHGPAGHGDGPVVTGAGKFPYAPSLVAGTALQRSDGYIYGIIAVGRGFMPPYGERVRHEDRWAIVSYVRTLQGSRANPQTPNPGPSAPGAAAAAQAGAPTTPATATQPPAPAGTPTTTSPAGGTPGGQGPR